MNIEILSFNKSLCCEIAIALIIKILGKLNESIVAKALTEISVDHVKRWIKTNMAKYKKHRHQRFI